MGPLMRRIMERQGQPEGTFQAKAEAPRKARWVELHINQNPTFDHPRVATKAFDRSEVDSRG